MNSNDYIPDTWRYQGNCKDAENNASHFQLPHTMREKACYFEFT